MNRIPRKYALLTILCILLPLSLPAEEADTLYYEITARLLVGDRQEAADSLTGWAESRGGYFIRKSLDEVTLRLPDGEVPGLRAYLEEISDEVVDYSQNTFDLRESLMQSRSALEARQEILEKNISYIATSDVEGTLTLEQEIRRLMNEIDAYSGMLRKMENDRSYAAVTVLLSFRTRTLPDSRPSRFDWVNSVDFYRFQEADMTWRRSGWGGPSLPLPEGFALVDDQPEYRAVSPEGVRLRLRSEKNYPEQSGAFWREALFGYLEGRGYVPVGGEETLSLDEGGEFTLRKWGVPLGNDDYLYLTGLRLNRGKIEILEISGLARYVKEYF